MPETIKIYWQDLTKAKQQEILQELGITEIGMSSLSAPSTSKNRRKTKKMRLEEMKCSVCGSFVPAFRRYDNVGLVEYRYECPCGHIEHWAYGSFFAGGPLMRRK